MIKMTKKLFVVASTVVALTIGSQMAIAQERQAVSSISELLKRIRNDAALKSKESQQRLAAFRKDVNQQQALLNRAQGELNALRARERQNAADFDRLTGEVAEKRAELDSKLGDLSELFGVTRQAAKTYRALIDESMTTAEFGRRTNLLNDLAESEILPTVSQLQQLWRIPAEELLAQSQISKFNLQLAEEGEKEAIRAGVFMTVLKDGRMAFYEKDLRAARASTAPTPSRTAAAISDIFSADPGEVVLGPVDPAFGALVRTEELRPNLQERVGQGGNIGTIIVIILILGVALGAAKMIALVLTRMALAGQAGKPANPSKGNALGRVLLAAGDSNDIETVEINMDAAIIQESSRFERGMNFLKLGAAIAPLLGLLGTVVGMIKVFESITLYGTDDPSKMAGGISEALVTTMLGLTAAVPILVLHAICYSMARSNQQIIEEQSAALVAQRMSGK